MVDVVGSLGVRVDLARVQGPQLAVLALERACDHRVGARPKVAVAVRTSSRPIWSAARYS